MISTSHSIAGWKWLLACPSRGRPYQYQMLVFGLTHGSPVVNHVEPDESRGSVLAKTRFVMKANSQLLVGMGLTESL